MKKNKPFGELFYRSLKKTLLTMRIAVILMILGILQTRANDAYSQKTMLSLNFSETPLVKVLDKIEDESEFFFLYNEKLLDTDRKVNIDAKDQLVSVILDKLFTGTDVQYTIIDRKIILAPGYLTEALQQKQITGTVKGKDGSPLPGVNIVVTGTTLGVMTDISGKFRIDVPQEAKSMTFSFIGMESQVINIRTLSQIDVTMAESAIGLDEVVVIGYGAVKKSDLNGSITSVTANSYKDQPVLNIPDALQGKTSGVSITNTSGAPGGNVKIRVRGPNSINGGNNPLYVVDGVALSSVSLGDININDVESMEILKDASATAIYGSRGANGVMLITTKRGKAGVPRIEYNGFISWNKLMYKYDLLNPVEYATLVNHTAGTTPPIFDNPESFAGKGTDWQDMLFQTALTNNH